MYQAGEDEIVFEADADLFNEQKTQVLVFKNKTKVFEVATYRKLVSYCWEFCGLTGLSYHTLRFTIMGRDIKPDTVLSNGCNISVCHKAEFAMEPPNSLKSSLRSIITSGDYSDLRLEYGAKSAMQAHKCILGCRSPYFDKILSGED